MQINLDKKTGILLSIIFALLISVVFIAYGGMRESDSDNDHMGMMNGHGHNSTSQMVGSDKMFLQMMIPHHEQAVEMSDLALSTSKNAEVLKLAKQIKGAQAPEIINMRGWLADAGLSEDPGHSMGNGMGAMLSDSELSALKGSKGKAFATSMFSALSVFKIPIAAHVLGPTTPSTIKPCDFCQSLTAASVLGPKSPSTVNFKNSCNVFTDSPLLPRLNTITFLYFSSL